MSRAEFKTTATDPTLCAIAAMMGERTPMLASAIAMPLYKTANTNKFSRIRRFVTHPSRISVGTNDTSGRRIPTSAVSSASGEAPAPTAAPT